MKKSIYLYIYLSICLFVSLNGQSTNSQDVEKGKSIQRNATYNLEEIKVRWKKAALENCTGVPCVPFNCGTSTISDIDGNSYNTVLIGTQCWTKENLKVTKYNDGTAIPDETANTAGWGGLATGARTDYTGATGIPSGQTYVSTYGYLYNWYAVKGIATAGSTTYKNICPTGWHVPTDAEWTTLTTELGGESVAGGKMKSIGTAYWNSTNAGATNESGFSALPGGYRLTDGSFNNLRSSAAFWRATQVDANGAWFSRLDYNSSNVSRNSYQKQLGASIRCLKD